MGSWKLVVAAKEAPCLNGANISGNACAKGATGWVYLNGTGRFYIKPRPNQTCDPGPCLFNLEDDPLEKHDLSGCTTPTCARMLTTLQARLQQWNATRVPNQVFPCDPLSCPAHSGGVWMPWLNSTPPMPPIPPPAPDVASSVADASKWARTPNGTLLINGWVCDKTVPSKATEPAHVTIRLNNTHQATVQANLHRERLVSLGFCPDNYHGFQYYLEPGHVNAGRHVLRFTIITRAGNETYELKDSPQCLCNGKSCAC